MVTFRAMNTEVAVTARGNEEAIARRVAATFAQAEQRFSRFRQDSELSALNRAVGPFQASSELFELLCRARRHVQRTGGLFDPTIGALLAALGYDRSFAPGALDRSLPAPLPRAARMSDLVLDQATRTVLRPPHVQLDLGGLAKGYTVDQAAEHLGEWGAIDAGGDAVARGTAWLVDVEDPRDPERVIMTFTLSGAAVATSAPNRRRWRLGSGEAHHLIDPRSGRSSSSDLLQVTVVAPSAELADVLAKTTFLLGAREGERFLERQAGSSGVLVPASGPPRLVGEVHRA